MNRNFEEAPLNDREWAMLDEIVIENARRNLIGRRFLDIYGPLGQGIQSVVNDIIDQPGHGSLSFHGKDLDLSSATKRVHLTIPLLYKDFELYWRDLEQAKALDIPIDFSPAANAVTQCALLEDDLIFNGSTEFDLPGLTNVKGHLSHIREDWMKSGNAFSDIVEARNKLLQMGHSGPYALVLSPKLYALLHRVHQGTNVLEIEHVRELVTDGVYQSPVLKGDSGVLIATGRHNVDLVIAEDINTTYMDSENMNHYFRIYECIVPRIKRPNAICTLEDPNS
ncbi:family 1 encapsulin nanocompartment shell protein [Anaerobacillus sp. MEB173]|uniref:family 1 encapsulin nanocompartment shell protein n=1 Tax=Anaerobacillus sp. MEB173 TaxID=3383345 RepID=UPI003F92BE36